MIGQRSTTAVVALAASATAHLVASYLWSRRAETHPDGRLDDAQRILAETSERYRSLFDHHPSAVFSLDLDGRFTAANTAAERVSGYTEAQLQGMFFADILRPEHLEPVAEAFERVLGRDAQQLETVIRTRTGTDVELHVTGLPIIVDDRLVGVYGIAENVTERNRMQRELHETRVRAEQASDAKSMFLANVSHEIRTPLTAVLATAELLVDSELDDDQVPLADTMLRSGQRLLRLVNELLDFSAIEAGKATVYDVALDLPAVVLDVVALARPAAEEKGLSLAVDVDPTLSRPLTGDPERIAQVLTNLLSNAVKFTDEGSVHVRVEVAERTPAATKVLFRVEDTGIGLTEAQQGRLFESFSQGDQSVSRRYGGTGLGLAICKQLVTLMGGSIWVSATPGAGSTFAFVLPLARADGAAASG
ncbi:sensor histidine kinase [Nocardioides lianchengensis]|uniref:Circadian input-output histidine kinase CikA n=1 Tax=Nocardioides lianchengensis TaxID=1045774 RepID=A0A1G6V1K6_9ACTN|nr:ATP-binding protein [Nocardioides lianchengensis]NYG11109.1 PAS domain S-box-containing protein [Nocardioides lianchengensis]SDD47519.1 PAS domain S-box-containing protein [Nocardioides lianchengensis]